MSDSLHAVLLAAGEGSRLRPLTDHVPKPLLPIDGRPVIDTLLEQLDRVGVDSWTLITGYLGDVLQQYLRARTDTGRVRWVEQAERLGSAHALQCALAQGLPHIDAVVVATDTVWRDEDVAHVVNAFRTERPMVTMGVRRWPLDQLPHRSSVGVDADGRVHAIIEKPASTEPTAPGSGALSGSPLYVFRADFWEYIAVLQANSRQMYELADALQAAIDDGHEVRAIEVFDTRDITRPNDLLRFNFPYLAELIPDLPTP